MTQQYEHPGVGHVKTLGNPVKLSRSPARAPKGPSSLGADNEVVFGELGYSRAEMDALRGQRAI
jgi:crotonobetainyl-CoA:carnitine CoA-transferase CaiB-like acyl-CoA transferase